MPRSPDRRGFDRLQVALPAFLFSDGVDAACIVVNLSVGGAGIVLPGYVDWRRGLPDILDVAGRGAFRVQVRWMSGRAMGLAFADSDYALSRLPELRRLTPKGG